MNRGGRRHARSVLVLGSETNRALSQTLGKVNLEPKFVRTLPGVVHALRRMQASAVLIDRGQEGVDALELVLNIRDLDGAIPIILIGSRGEGRTDAILAAQPGTFLIRKASTNRSLEEDLKRLKRRGGFSKAH